MGIHNNCPIDKKFHNKPICASGSLKVSIENLKIPYRIRKRLEIMPDFDLRFVKKKRQFYIINKINPSKNASYN